MARVRRAVPTWQGAPAFLKAATAGLQSKQGVAYRSRGVKAITPSFVRQFISHPIAISETATYTFTRSVSSCIKPTYLHRKGVALARHRRTAYQPRASI